MPSLFASPGTACTRVVVKCPRPNVALESDAKFVLPAFVAASTICQCMARVPEGIARVGIAARQRAEIQGQRRAATQCEIAANSYLVKIHARIAG